MNTRPEDAMLSDGNPAKSMSWLCEDDANIQESDILVIDSVEYVVKGIAITQGFRMGLRFKRAIVVKSNS
jgi:hypothetical protein